MKKFRLPFMAILMTINLIGCFYQPPVKISIPNDSTALRSPDPDVWRSDPTRVLFRNYSTNIYIRIWVERNPVGTPDLELAPEESWPFNFPGIGVYTIYIAGREATVAGWQNLGVKKRPVDIYPSGSGREIPVGDWDFPEYYQQFFRHRPPPQWHPR